MQTWSQTSGQASGVVIQGLKAVIFMPMEKGRGREGELEKRHACCFGMPVGMHGERLKGRLASLGGQMGFGPIINWLWNWA